MSKRKNITPLSREFSDTEIENLVTEMQNWFHIKEDNIHIDDFLYLEKKLLATDVENLYQNNEAFKIGFQNAEKIELAKLKKYASGDRLNAAIVKQILINKHGWL